MRDAEIERLKKKSIRVEEEMKERQRLADIEEQKRLKILWATRNAVEKRNKAERAVKAKAKKEKQDALKQQREAKMANSTSSIRKAKKKQKALLVAIEESRVEKNKLKQ